MIPEGRDKKKIWLRNRGTASCKIILYPIFLIVNFIYIYIYISEYKISRNGFLIVLLLT